MDMVRSSRGQLSAYLTIGFRTDGTYKSMIGCTKGSTHGRQQGHAGRDKDAPKATLPWAPRFGARSSERGGEGWELPIICTSRRPIVDRDSQDEGLEVFQHTPRADVGRLPDQVGLSDAGVFHFGSRVATSGSCSGTPVFRR